MEGVSSFRIFLILAAFIFVGCGRINSIQSKDLTAVSDQSPQVVAPPPSVGEPSFAFQSLSWETQSPTNKKWSNYVFNLINDQEFEKLDRAQDAAVFCPRYNRLSRLEKVNFWGALISGMSRFESAYKPTARMLEQGLGNDVVTGRQLASEGLLQMSYSDAKYNSFCRMDWAKDQNKKDSDPTKTIFDPYINLECGVKILSKQVAKHGKIIIESGAYWSVIKSGHRNEKVDEISAIVQRLSFCGS